MIDWVSIVRHSRRRFSTYMSVPKRIRRQRQRQAIPQQMPEQYQQQLQQKQKVEPPQKTSEPTSTCACCGLTRKYRYQEEDVPPPPPPAHLKDIIGVDGLPRNIFEREGQFMTSITDSPRKIDYGTE